MSVDLHLHTHHSDGSWSPTRLVNRACELNLKHIAITDHDTMNGIEEAIAAAAGRLEIIPGIEINTIWKDPHTGVREDVHILGYFLDPTNVQLKSILKRQQEARLALIDDTIELLSKHGINITFAQIESFAGIGSIGRPHITQAIVKAGGAADVNAAYEKFMTRGAPCFIERNSVSPSEAVAAITAAGGIASVAHPGKSTNIKDIILILKDSGLAAIEVYHRRHSVALIQQYIRFANRHGFLITGGSDCHGPHGDYQASIGSTVTTTRVVSKLKSFHKMRTPSTAC